MEKAEIRNLIANSSTETVIERLSEEVSLDYDEYTMLKLSEVYLDSGDLNNAKKLLKKTQRLYPNGEYSDELDILKKRVAPSDNKETCMVTESEDKEQMLSDYTGSEKKREESLRKKAESSPTKKNYRKEKAGKRERKIPENIEECFKGVVGLADIKKDLDDFYHLLLLQHERQDHDFQQELIRSTHFYIAGARGCGKTMVANILARLLYEFNLRTDDEAVQMAGRDIIRAYDQEREVGINKLFSDVYGKTVIIENMEDIIKEREYVPIRQIALWLEKIMRDHSNDCSIIMTGTYQAFRTICTEDETFEDVLHKVLRIEPYTSHELVSITEKLATERALRLHESAKKSLEHQIEREFRNETFLNAITLSRYLESAAARMGERYRKLKVSGREISQKDLVLLLPEDFGLDHVEDETVDELLAELDSLTGLASVKEQVRRQVESVQVMNQAKEAGAERKGKQGSMHMLFVGNPGTGKTTVARLIGRIYHALGVLSNGETHECQRQDLVAGYVGWTAPKVQKKVKESMGGVLFIDEAYSLKQNESDSFGQEAVDALVAEMENNRDNLLVILAGYPDDMREFLKSNVGLSSRIRKTITFEDYTLDEMTDIYKGLVKKENMQLDKGAEEFLPDFIAEGSRVKDFGNARGVRNLFEDTLEAVNRRISMDTATKSRDKNADYYKWIRQEDLEAVVGTSKKNKKSFDELMDELDSMIGLEGAKKKVREMINSARVNAYMKQAGMSIGKNSQSLHLVFKGNAGTGKTVVARLLGQIYAELGVLPKNVFVEAKRADLVAGYLGQTAPKVIAKVNEADGGVLFVDEAYALKTDEGDSFGQEAIDQLLTEIENRRDSLMVIVAGYPQEMDRFLDTNQGLASRLSNEILFEDYSLEELQQIFVLMIKQNGLLLQEETESDILEVIKQKKESVKDFGNARGVRNIFEQVRRRRDTRLAQEISSGKHPTETEMRMITREDIVGE